MGNREMELRIDLKVGRDHLLAQDRPRVLEEAGLVHRSVGIGLGEDGDVDPEERVARKDVGVQLLVTRRRGGEWGLASRCLRLKLTRPPSAP